MAKKKKTVYSGIGGQAVLEGIMMKNKDQYAVAVRLPNGKIEVQRFLDGGLLKESSVWKKIPFVRGIFNFIDSLVLGMKTLSFSASFFDEEDKKTNQDRSLEKKAGKHAEDVATGFTVFLSIILAVGLFMILPYFLSELIGKYLESDTLTAVFEGLLRLVIFLLYVSLISLMKDIKRVYMYHGAEHKCINCVENGRPLTVENVKRSSRFHRRCGTSFLLIVMVISIVLFFFIRVETVYLRVLLRIALIPVIAGISYEFLRLAGRFDNGFIRFLSAPGLLLQRITTKEPTEDMIEVAIAAVERVFDWEKFENKNFTRKTVKKKAKNAEGQMVETGEETMEIDVVSLEQILENQKTDYSILGDSFGIPDRKTGEEE